MRQNYTGVSKSLFQGSTNPERQKKAYYDRCTESISLSDPISELGTVNDEELDWQTKIWTIIRQLRISLK